MREDSALSRPGTRAILIAGLACVLALLSASGAARGDDTITVQGEDVESGPGGAVSFQVSGHSAEPIGAFGISVTYDDTMLTPISCQASGVLCIKGALPGELRINGASINGYSGGITFATIIFSTGYETGVVPVGIEVTTVADVMGTDLGHLAESSDGSVTIDGGVASTPSGDANCDSKVTAADGLALLYTLAGGDPACSEIADVNCDDKVNAADVLALLRGLGGLPYETKGICSPVV